jgi:site-specific DNA-methyltransferase (adenine-specific)
MAISPARVSATDLASIDAMEHDALDAIESVTEPGEAERLLAKVRAVQEAQRLARLGADYEKRWGVVRLKAERKYGTLLGKAESGRPEKNVSSGHVLSNAERTAAKKARQVAAVPDEVFEDYVDQAEEPTRAELLRTTKAAKKSAHKQERHNREANATRDVITADQIDFRISACSALNVSEPVDAIITDPPYPKQHLDCYTELADFAVRSLRPGGSLIAMAGQSYLPEVISRLNVNGLKYQWTLAYLTPGGQSTQLWERNVNTFWKPLLWFVKDSYEGSWIGDVTKSEPNDNDKRFHHWGQSESGMADIVRRFTQPGELIVDPFLGGGTTAIVSLNLGRRFIGADVDADAIETSTKRLL